MFRSLTLSVSILPWLVLGQVTGTTDAASSTHTPAAQCGSSSNPDLLADPSFELPDPNDNWEVYGMQMTDLQVSTTNPLDGNQHLVIPGTVEEVVNPGNTSMIIGPQIYQNVNTQPSIDYFLSFSFRPQVLDASMTGDKTCLASLFYDGINPDQGLDTMTFTVNKDSDYTWQTLSGILQTTQASNNGGTQVTFRMLVACDEPDAGFEIWIDNATMRQLDVTESCNTLPPAPALTSAAGWASKEIPPSTTSTATPSSSTTPTSPSAGSLTTFQTVTTSGSPFSTTTTSLASLESGPSNAVTVTAPAVTVTAYSTVEVTATTTSIVTAYSTTTVTTTVSATATAIVTDLPAKKLKRRGCQGGSGSAITSTSGSTATGSQSGTVTATSSASTTTAAVTVTVTPTVTETALVSITATATATVTVTAVTTANATATQTVTITITPTVT
ncbi:hypothetical protein BX600DRAFT_490991 [Xylariales sp. PMI_506]|nr:hypothetical protein BX600DRAFT_490991 [Xylariales sp. PMI_506]